MNCGSIRQRALLFILVFGFVSIDLHGQEYVQHHFGLKGGLNYSGFRQNVDLKFGWNAGIVGKRYLSDLGWFLQIEGVYSKEGNINQPLEFINVPILFGFDFSDSFNMHLGYQSGFLVGTMGNTDTQYKNYNPTFVFGFEFYTFTFTSLGARYNYGLSDIEEGTGTSVTYTFEVYFIAWFKKL